MVAGNFTEELALAVQQHRHAAVELHRALPPQFPHLAAIENGLGEAWAQGNHEFLFGGGHGVVPVVECWRAVVGWLLLLYCGTW